MASLLRRAACCVFSRVIDLWIRIWILYSFPNVRSVVKKSSVELHFRSCTKTLKLEIGIRVGSIWSKF